MLDRVMIYFNWIKRSLVINLYYYSRPILLTKLDILDLLVTLRFRLCLLEEFIIMNIVIDYEFICKKIFRIGLLKLLRIRVVYLL